MNRRRITEALLNSDNAKENEVTAPTLVKLPTVKLSEKNNSLYSTKRQMLYSVSPDECKPWSFHDRDSSWLTDKKCADLIASIKLNGQKFPVLARSTDSNNAKHIKYEIIAGARRWFACKYLGKKLDVILTDSDDQECSVFMHIENKERDDISDFERAISYKNLLKSGIFESQDALALSLGLKKSSLSKMLAATTLLDHKFISNAINNITQIPIKPAYELSVLLKNKDSLLKIKHHMDNIKKSKKPTTIKTIIKQLLQTAKEQTADKTTTKFYATPSQKSEIALTHRKGKLLLEFSLPPQNKEQIEIKKLLVSMIDELIHKGNK